MSKKTSHAESIIDYEKRLLDLDAKKRILREEIHMLERELIELHHLLKEKKPTCPYCKQHLTKKILEPLMADREEELEQCIEDLDKVREIHSKVEANLVEKHKQLDNNE